MNTNRHFHTVENFHNYLKMVGLNSTETYTFQTAIHAEMAAGIVRDETKWILTWDAPHKFHVA